MQPTHVWFGHCAQRSALTTVGGVPLGTTIDEGRDGHERPPWSSDCTIDPPLSWQARPQAPVHTPEQTRRMGICSRGVQSVAA